MQQSFKSQQNRVSQTKQLPPISYNTGDQQSSEKSATFRKADLLDEEEDQAGAQAFTTQEQATTNFVERNQQKLIQMQEGRLKEKQMIENEREKVKRKQEKLKNQILKQAEEYKQVKL